MENLDVLSILLGVGLTILIYEAIKWSNRSAFKEEQRKYFRDILNLSNNAFTFGYRRGDYVKIWVKSDSTNQYNLQLDLTESSVALMKNGKAVQASNTYNKHLNDKIFYNMTDIFHNEIFEDIILVDGEECSSNLHGSIIWKGTAYDIEPIQQEAKELSEAEKIEEIDYILDKITESGIDSLTPEEKDFLDKNAK